MFAFPMLTPVTWAEAVVCPAGIVTVVDTVAFVVSLLVRVTVTAEAGAEGSVTAKLAVPPNCTVVLAGSPIAPTLCTVTFAVASGIKGSRLAWSTVLPGDPPVTWILTAVWPDVKVAFDGTEATLELSELRFTVTPEAGAFAERFRVMFWFCAPVRVNVPGLKLTVATTSTDALADT
jgi:hypothetical protein